MFENVGEKIKALAKVICAVGIVFSIIVAIFMFYMADEYYRVEEVYYTLGVIILILGPISSWTNSLLIYGFGELIEATCSFKGKVSDINNLNRVAEISELPEL